ncbi:MAG: hypothetical protein ABSD85_07105 [Acidimicrobiales bacterium]
MSLPRADMPDEDGAFVEVLAGGTQGPRLGTVQAFDAERGRGVVVVSGGGAFGFHATAIADRSRQIRAGSMVSFTIVAAPGGRFEAGGLTALEGPSEEPC